MAAIGLGAYRAATWALSPLAPIALRARAARGKEDPARVGERLGRASAPRPAGRLVWLHGVSVGESLVMATLADALAQARPDLALLVTTGTRTAAETAAKRLHGRAVHQFAPIDAPPAVKRFLDHWRPDLGVLAESELWPNLLLGAKARGVTLALVNARMTGRSLARWRRWPASAARLVSAFDTIAAADERTFAGLKALGAQRIALAGNLKAAASPPPADNEALEALRAAIDGRPVWLAASTHEGEEAVALDAHKLLKADGGRPLLIVAPRHPERGSAVAALAEAAGFAAAQRSKGAPPADATDVYVADTLGEMGLWYRLADAALIGGSLAPGIGGHNPLEPALLRAPIVTGPHTFNFEAIFDEMIAVGGAARVHNARELACEIRLLRTERASERAEAAFAAASRGGDVLQIVLDLLGPLLPDATDARSA